MKLKTRYRIVRDKFSGYEAQYKRWWFPFWLECFFTNTSDSIEKARMVVDMHRNRVVEVFD